MKKFWHTLVNKFKQQKSQTVSPVLKKFEIDSDTRLGKFGSTTLMLGVAAGIYFTLVKFVIPIKLKPKKPGKPPIEVVTEFEFPPKRVKIPNPGSGGNNGGEKNGEGKKGGQKKPPTPKQILKHLFATADGASSNNFFDKITTLTDKASDAIKKISKLKNNSNKVGNNRLGKSNKGFNPGQLPGSGKGLGIGDLPSINGIPGGSGNSILNPTALEVKWTEITLGTHGSRRSGSSIQKTIRSRLSGLRHIYNQFLAKFPGMAGKVFLKLEISPSGRVIKISIVNSTTGNNSFDKLIRKKVKRWHFEKITGKGMDVVTVPFTFSE